VLAGETGSHEIELRPADWWRHRGVTVRYGYRVTEIDTGRRELKIEGEESMEYSKLVLAVGSTPLRLNVPGADLDGVHTFRDTRGIVANDEMQTASSDIYALGECAEHSGTCYGLVERAYEQARMLARHLAGRPAAYQGSVVSTNLKVSGVSVFSAGDFMGGKG